MDIKQGRFPEIPGEIALEKHFARFQKAELGDVFQIGEHPFTICGIIEIKEGAQVAAANIYMPLNSARILLKNKPDAINLIYLRLNDPSMLNRVKSQLSSEISGLSISSSDSFLELMDFRKVFPDCFNDRVDWSRTSGHENNELPSIGTFP